MFLLSQEKNDWSSPQKYSGDLEHEPGPPTNDNYTRLGDIQLKRCELRLKRCDISDQGGNTRLSEQRLLLSGDIEKNPGPLSTDISLDTNSVCWDRNDNRRNQSDSVNTHLSEHKLLLSGDMEDNPGPPQQKIRHLDTSRVWLDLSPRGRNDRLCDQKLLLSGDVELNPGPPKQDMFRVCSHLWRSTRVLVHTRTSYGQF